MGGRTGMQKDEFKVYFEGNFWGHSGRAHAGKAVAVGKSFKWAGNEWYIPALYICSQGIVIDYCVGIESQKIKDFEDKYAKLVDACCCEGEEYEMLMNNNPTDVDFTAFVSVNSKELKARHGCGVCWMPKECLMPEECNCSEAEEVAAYYGLDKSKGWVIQRCSYAWNTLRKPRLNKITLKLKKSPVAVRGIKFKTPLPEKEIKFVHPITGTEHVLTITGLEKEKHKVNKLMPKYKFPEYSTHMTYTLTPDIPDMEYNICDVRKNDTPVLKDADSSDSLGASIAIIGGADGPTAIFMSRTQDKIETHMACSALTFEPVEEVTWCMSFWNNMYEDMEIVFDSVTAF